jgi:hypothetical protein
MPKFIDISGQKFGRLLAKNPVTQKLAAKKWACLCDCGNIAVVAGAKLRNGHTQSCGCLQKERASEANLRHGQTGYPRKGRPTKEYNTWSMMLKRCRNKNAADYSSYGGRGISVCERWNSFENFFFDMGAAPSPKHSIDRIDVNGNYCKENCRWADAKTQGRNRRSTLYLCVNGVTKPVSEWSEITGIKYKRIHARLKRGKSPSEALLPIKKLKSG